MSGLRWGVEAEEVSLAKEASRFGEWGGERVAGEGDHEINQLHEIKKNFSAL